MGGEVVRASPPSSRPRYKPHPTMKTLLLICASFFATGILLAQDVSLEVTPMSGGETSGPDPRMRTRDHWLNVRVVDPMGNGSDILILRWKLYAEDLARGAHAITLQQSGEQSFQIAPNGHFADVITAKVPFTSTPEHTERTGRWRWSYYKRIDSAGKRYRGYSVQVLRGTTIVGTAVSDEVAQADAEATDP